MLTINISGVTASITEDAPLLSGTIGMPVKFTFSSEWANLNKVAVYERLDPVRTANNSYADIALSGTSSIESTIPANVLNYTGVLKIGVCGTDGSNRKVTVFIPPKKILQGAVPSGFIPPIQPTIVEQILNIANHAVPQIGTNGNWYLYDIDTKTYVDSGIYSGGQAPYIGANGHWYVGSTDTGVNATGPKGDDGTPGADGEDGTDGADGEDGFSPVITVTTISGGHSVAVTDAEGTQSFNVMDGANGQNGVDGADGQDGEDGQDGYAPVVTVTSITGGHKVDITDAEHQTTPHTFNVMDGAPGTTSWAGIADKPSSFPPSSHTHDDRYYTESETNALLAGKADTSHNHDSAYYTKSQIDAMIGNVESQLDALL